MLSSLNDTYIRQEFFKVRNNKLKDMIASPGDVYFISSGWERYIDELEDYYDKVEFATITI